MFHKTRRWWPLLGALGGYIAWDIIDQTILQPRNPLIDGYLVDWGVAGLTGLATFMIVQRRHQRRTQPSLDSDDSSATQQALSARIAAAVTDLDHWLREIDQHTYSLNDTTDTAQLRAVKGIMLAVHQAQSLADEIAGLSSAPRTMNLPAPHELHDSSSLSTPM